MSNTTTVYRVQWDGDGDLDYYVEMDPGQLSELKGIFKRSGTEYVKITPQQEGNDFEEFKEVLSDWGIE